MAVGSDVSSSSTTTYPAAVGEFEELAMAVEYWIKGLAHFVIFECRFRKSDSATAASPRGAAPANFPVLESVQGHRQTFALECVYGFGLGQFVGRPPLFEKLDQR